MKFPKLCQKVGLMTSCMVCEYCGFQWVEVHHASERLQCICGVWCQVPPCQDEYALFAEGIFINRRRVLYFFKIDTIK